ncbi:hypothetical protein LQV05_006458 [Cryptococcus neoformans]|nr:hypothetical protein LQV05_006458 [Cryptococcus neoformans]
MKVFENDLVYNYPASHTLNLLHRKYPNPFATHVYSVDTMERSIDPETGVLRSERLIGVQQGAPKWVTKQSTIDLKLKMDKEATPKPVAHDYRGACVEDLQLPPAFCLPGDAPLLKALEAAYDREFDHLPILNAKRRPIGYLDIPSIKDQFKNNKVNGDEPVFPGMCSEPNDPLFFIQPISPLYRDITVDASGRVGRIF